jgi:predicted nucleic acid-binding protein
MGFLIDTNVLSELRKKDRANIGVQCWYSSVQGADLYISVLVIGEIPVIDGLLAATALEHDLILVTRNTRDVKGTGVRFENPFSPE